VPVGEICKLSPELAVTRDAAPSRTLQRDAHTKGASAPDAGSDGKRPAEVCLESSVLYPVFAETMIQITKRPLQDSSETQKVHIEGRWVVPGPAADVQHRAAGGPRQGAGGALAVRRCAWAVGGIQSRTLVARGGLACRRPVPT